MLGASRGCAKAPSIGPIPTFRSGSRNAELNRTNVNGRAPSLKCLGSPPGQGSWTAVAFLSRCATQREIAPRACEKRRLTPISAADWLSSAPKATSHFWPQALACGGRLVSREAWVVGDHLVPLLVSRPSSRRCRQRRPRWQGGWCRACQPPPSHPRACRPVSWALPWVACSATVGTDATTTDALVSPEAPLPASRCARPVPGPVRDLTHQRQKGNGPKAPCRRQVPSLPGGLALACSHRAATVPRLCHRETSFRRSVTALPSNR